MQMESMELRAGYSCSPGACYGYWRNFEMKISRAISNADGVVYLTTLQ